MVPVDNDSSDSRSAAFSLQRADHLSFEAICRSVRPILKSIIEARLDLRLLQRVDASDIVQETLLEAVKRLPDFLERQPMPLVSWLRESALQQLALCVRRHQLTAKRTVTREVNYHESSIFQLVERITASHVDAQQRHLETEQSQRVRRALYALSHTDREILLLRYVNELTNAEAATVLKVTETVASKRHCRALVRLQQRLERERE